MRKHFFNRFLVIALILVFTCSLSVPAFAAADDLGYQYAFVQEFDFSQFALIEGTAGWYGANIGVDFDPVATDGNRVRFSIDTHNFISSFKVSESSSKFHYIGNSYAIYEFGEQNDDPYCLIFSFAEPEKNMLYLRSDLYDSLFQGDAEKIHVAMAVPLSYFEPDTFLDKFFSLFSDIGQWLRNTIDLIVGLFWNAKAVQLTFFGVLSLVSLGFSVVLLLIKVILNFLHLRG